MKNIYALCYSVLVICCLANISGCNNGPRVDIKVEQDIAINNIKFGITEKQFKNLVPNDSLEIDARDYLISPFFNGSDQLYMVYFMGLTSTEDGIEVHLKDEIERLKVYFSNKYGKPQKLGSYQSAKNLPNGNSVEIYKWTIGYKKIVLGIGLEGRDTKTYYVIGHIDHTKMRKLANKEGLD